MSRPPNSGAIPNVPATTDAATRQFLEAVREKLQVYQGQRGDSLDKAVTFRDFDERFGSLRKGLILDIKREINNGAPTPEIGGPTGFGVVGVFGQALIYWDEIYHNNYTFTEVFRVEVPLNGARQPIDPIPPFSDTYRIATISGSRLTDTAPSGTGYAYWARHVNASGIPSAFAGPVLLDMIALPSDILDQLQRDLDNDAFAAMIAARIEQVDTSAIYAAINVIDANLAAADLRLTAADAALSQTLIDTKTFLQGQLDYFDQLLDAMDASLGLLQIDMSAMEAAQIALDNALLSAKNALQAQIDTQGGAISAITQITDAQALTLAALTFSDGENKSAIIDLSQVDAAQALRLTSLETDNGTNKTKITSLESTSATQATKITALEATDGTLASRITTAENVSTGIASRVGTLETDNGTNKTNITSLQTTTATQATAITRLGAYDTAAGKYSFIKTLEQVDAAQALRLTSLETDNGTNKTKITSLESTSATQATKISALEATDGTLASRITTAENVSTGIASRVGSLETDNGTNKTNISTLQTTTATQATAITRLGAYDTAAGKYSFIKTLEQVDAAQALRLTSLETDNGTNKTNITSLQTASATHAMAITRLGAYDTAAGKYSFIKTLEQVDAAQALRLTSLETDNGTNKSKISTLETTTGGQATRLTAVETKAENARTAVITLQQADVTMAQNITTVSTNLAAVEDLARAYLDPVTGSLVAERTLKVDANGNVAGIGLRSQAGIGSEINFLADRIRFVNPNNTDESLALQVQDGQLYFNRATASYFTVENLIFKNATGLNLAVISDLILPSGVIVESNLHPDFLRRLVMIDPNAASTGGSSNAFRSLSSIGTSLSAQILGGGNLTKITINVSSSVELSVTQARSAPLPTITAPTVQFRVKRGSLALTIPAQVLNAIPELIVVDSGNKIYQLTGTKVTSTEIMPRDLLFWGGRASLSSSFSFDAGNFTGSSLFAIEVVGYSGNIDGFIRADVFEPSGSTGGLVVNTAWSSITDVPITALRWPTWLEVSGRPESFTPSSHFHQSSEVSGLGNAAARNIGTTAGTVMDGGDARVANGQTAYSWGNHASQGYLRSGGAGASGEWGISVTGYSRYIDSPDLRSSTLYPSSFAKGLHSSFVNTSSLGMGGGNFTSLFTFRGYGAGSDMSGGPVHQLAFRDIGDLWHRSGTSGWAAWNKIAMMDSSGHLYATRFYSTSSLRYKDVLVVDDALESVRRVRLLGAKGVSVGVYKADETRRLNRWLIAEDVNEVSSEVVSLDKKGRVNSLDMTQLIPDLYVALAQALNRIDALEALVNAQ